MKAAVVLVVLAIALVLVTGAVLFRLLQPRYVSARVAIEYGVAFFFFLAAAAFRAGILGRRVKPRVWEPDQDWLAQARKEATATFFVMLAVAWAYAAFNAVKSEIPGWLVVIAFLFMLASNPASRRAAADGSPGDAAILQVRLTRAAGQAGHALARAVPGRDVPVRACPAAHQAKS